MEFRDEKAVFTPSEAEWAQNATKLLNLMPALSQKILDARIAFAKSKLPAYQVPEISIRAARSDIVVHLRLVRILQHLHETALQHGVDAAQQEQHVIKVPMDAEDKRGLLLLAQADNQAAQECLEAPEIRAFEREMGSNDMAMFVATSDVMEPDQAVAFGDLVRDPEFNAVHERRDYEEAKRTLAPTASIITALAADLGE